MEVFVDVWRIEPTCKMKRDGNNDEDEIFEQNLRDLAANIEELQLSRVNAKTSIEVVKIAIIRAILVIEDENRTCSCVFIACARVYVVYSYSMLYSASESVSSTTSFSSTGAKSCSCIFSLVCIASTNCSTIVLSSPTTLETFDAISFA